MISFALSMLKSPKNIVLAAAVAGVGYLGWQVYSFVDEKHQFEVKIEQQERVISEHEAIIRDQDINLRTLNAALDNARDSLRISRETNERIMRERQQTQEIFESITTSGDENDGPISPVLRDTLDALGGLRPESPLQ